jgi:hypothetical protein
MTVVCINDRWVRDTECEGKPFPTMGDKDTVIDLFEKYGNTYYLLERFGSEQGFLTTHFVDVDDTPAEVIEEEETQLVTA